MLLLLQLPKKVEHKNRDIKDLPSAKLAATDDFPVNALPRKQALTGKGGISGATGGGCK